MTEPEEHHATSPPHGRPLRGAGRHRAWHFFWVNGRWIGPWLGRIVYPGGPGEYQIAYGMFGLLGGSVLGVAGGVYATGRVVGQTGTWWAALLGSLLGAVLVAVLMHGVFAELPLLLSWGLMGGGSFPISPVYRKLDID
jgi:hypothetical protein